MGVKGITIDTHTLVWYVDKTLKGKKLSKIALEMIREAEIQSTIYISVISLMEILDLVEKKRISVSFQTVLSAIEKNEAYRVITVDTELVKLTRLLPRIEIHDRLILATAVLTNSTLLSKDREIEHTGLNVIWSRRDDITETS